MGDVEPQGAVITGGARGIGLAIAQALHETGTDILLWDSDAEALRKAEDGFAAAGTACVRTDVVDVTDGGAVEAAAKRAEAARFGFQMLVHSAGIAGPALPLVDYPDTEWERVVRVNLVGSYNVNKACVRRMIARKYGRIVNIASIAGKEGNPNASAYSAAKAGVIALTKSLGKETADADISVNCITPAAARTDILDQVDQRHIDYMLAKIPRGRFVELGEIASMVLWLLSPGNSFTTGAVFDLSGGRATY